MKKLLLLTLLSCATTAPIWAQAPTPRPQAAPAGATPAAAQAPQGAGRITGTVVDSTTSKPVEFATIALINAATGKTVDGTVTDEKGRFVLTKVANGTYTLSISFIGYDTKELKKVTISAADQEAGLGSVRLSSSHTKLQEVTVVGEKPLIEDKVDRLVYNAEKDITNTGGTAADVMQKVPSISLDQDGNIQMRGSSNVRVLINGKPSTVMAGSVADALKQIPADVIKNVEIITSPSAKYDAEGTAGIVNIITKKNSLQGVTGSVTLTGGTRSSNGNANVGIKQGKLGINVNAGTNMFYSKGAMNIQQISQADIKDNPLTPAEEGDNPNTTVVEKERRALNNTLQQGTSTVDGMFGFGQLGLEYDLNEKNSLAAGIRVNTGTFKMRSHQLATSTQADQNEARTTFLAPRQTDQYNLSMKNNNQRLSMDLNLDFTHQFKKPQQELTLLALYSQTDQDNNVNQSRYEIEGPLRSTTINENEGLNKELTFQADYAHPMPKNTLLEVGAKGIMRDVSSSSLYNGLDLNGDFSYDQNVMASYLSYGFNLNKRTALKFGGRYEYTDVAGDFVNPEQDFTTHYDNFIPNVTLAYDLKPNMKLRTSFTQRIQRPQLFYLNPYRQQQGPNVVVFGNPRLDAELTDSYELNYSTFFKTTSLNASAYMRITDNAIETISEVLRDTTFVTFDNIAKNKTYGMSLSGSTKPIPAWNVNANLNFYYVDLNAPFASNAGWMYNINVSSGYTFGKGVSAQFSGGFNSDRVQLQGKASSFSYHNLAIRKELFAKKGALSLGMDNPFRRALKFENELAGNNRNNGLPFRTESLVTQYNRGFRLTFEYRFGKLQQQGPPKRRKSIRNDDAKQGDGGGVQ
ncbi:outer membrane beta-barrel family protein [Rufibacter quisquiliarum]|uniref:Outer membrane receptor protein involved in Fe transport n=1 Tax=Rufibacter quisquiliarum TaxID=1549639 RepID=A0A839GPX3_9BACT|nr:outer membrane beta-barrel family protein [Rufibacter quisquiliarum]MBA9076947.1 outer membrane receptor protein involved in Fe transport [Rufibacter quisquiliarum]